MRYIVLILLTFSVFAQKSLTVVAVGEADVVKDKILIEKAFFENIDPKTQASLERDLNVVRNDLRFYPNYFDVTKRSISKNSFDVVDYDGYSAKGINFLVRVQLVKNDSENLLSYTVYNIAAKDKIYDDSLAYTEKREQMHEISFNVFKNIVGKEPIFKSKIVFVSDRNGSQRAKELYMMDFDGANLKQLTRHGGLVISPSVSPSGDKVIYSLIDERKGGRKNINLMQLDLTTMKSKIISRRKGINSGATFSSDGNSLFLTLSHQGNAEIYKMDLATKKLERLTKHFAPDVDPSVTADGTLMSFLSGRPGKAMIYTMDPRGLEKNLKRISYVGDFNATPRFSPDGKEIVFSSWLDNRFDLFRINSDGSGLGRLTKDFGSNEDPDYSKDGQFIIFTSQRVISRSKAEQNVYIMDRNGKILGPLTRKFGNCISPRWLN
jgi:TolB protein